MTKNKKVRDSKDYVIPVPLGTYLETAEDQYILESLMMIKMKPRWLINSATLSLKEACEIEWKKRHGDIEIPDIELSDGAILQLKLDKENS